MYLTSRKKKDLYGNCMEAHGFVKTEPSTK